MITMKFRQKAHAGVDPYMIQKLMRHKSPAMMQRYAIHNVESLRDAAEAFEEKFRDKTVTLPDNIHDRSGISTLK